MGFEKINIKKQLSKNSSILKVSGQMDITMLIGVFFYIGLNQPKLISTTSWKYLLKVKMLVNKTLTTH